ncbi:HD domain-containing protein [Traorella massiliensis]|uniref:HD domain-containing protein n=1 Tax=Traorella massiliensis TaxID=1903263 RepID=UPI00248D44F9|nr:HD domain-containing protein [Traorella massiliensis]
MFAKTNEVKVMRDPVHGYIHVEYQVIWDCINAREFQRLRRIHQLGGTYMVYHTAEHSRFAHSLGVYEITRRMVNEVSGLKELSEEDKVTVMCAALLHDVGHGPFSHAFEAITPTSHETYTRRIILEDTQIHRILSNVSNDFPNKVASIIDYSHPNDLLNQIVSGQLDADRMDYLLRDAYFTGTSYGNFDLERILRTMRVKESKIVMKESGIHTVEDYIMARYHMYWQGYFHPVTRSYEAILHSIFKRLKDLYERDPFKLDHIRMFQPFLKQQDTVEDHFKMDESAALYGFTLLSESDDPIAADLARRLLNRDLFEYETISDESDLERIKKRVLQLGYDPEYYVIHDEAKQRPYQPYKSGEGHNIWILKEDGEIKELSVVSDIVSAIVHGKLKEDKKAFFPIK